MQKGYKGQETAFTRTLFEAEQSGSNGITVEDIRNRAVGLIFAGTHTSAITLTYLAWEVLGNPSVRERLLAEFRRCQADSTVEELYKIEYLDHVIHETMRLWPAAPAGLYRRATADSMLGGYHIPAGTAANAQA